MNGSFGPDHFATLLAELHRLFPSLSAVYVFGSAVHHQMHAESDVDLAVDIGRELTSAERWHAMQRLSVCMMRDIDLIDFRVASDVLRHQILTMGRRLFVRDSAAQSSYEAAVLSEYLDFVAQRAPLMQDIAARGYVYAR